MSNHNIDVKTKQCVLLDIIGEPCRALSKHLRAYFRSVNRIRDHGAKIEFKPEMTTIQVPEFMAVEIQDLVDVVTKELV